MTPVSVRLGYAECEKQHWCEVQVSPTTFVNGGGDTAEEAIAKAVEKVRAALTADLAGQPEAETMRQARTGILNALQEHGHIVFPGGGLALTDGHPNDVADRALEAAAPLLTAPWAAKCAALEAELREAHKVIADNIAEYQSALAAHDREKRKAWDELRTATDELDHIDQSLIGAKCRFDGDPETDILKRNIAERVAAVCECLPAAEAQLAAARGSNTRMLESLRTIAHLLQNPADAGHLLNGGNAFKLARDTYIAESDAAGKGV